MRGGCVFIQEPSINTDSLTRNTQRKLTAEEGKDAEPCEARARLHAAVAKEAERLMDRGMKGTENKAGRRGVSLAFRFCAFSPCIVTGLC